MLTLNISAQAWAILHALNEVDTLKNNTDLRAYAWYNGRERGICLSLYRVSKNLTQHVTFGECRNSDSIFIDTWDDAGVPSLNPPTVRDFPEYAYNGRRYCKPYDVQNAVAIILDMLA